MDSDLDVGRHCKQCNLKDFLPITCQYCQHDFCRSHIFEHSCDSRPTTTMATSAITTAGNMSFCSFCRQLSISTCSNCTKLVCSLHRFHNGCTSSTIPSTSLPAAKAHNSEARALLAKHFPVRAKPAVIAPKKTGNLDIQRMKMRHKAIPLAVKDGSTPIAERIHFEVVFGSQDKIFWCPKTMVTGRAVDLIAQSFHVTISDTTPAQLTSLGGEVFPNNNFMSQIKDGESVKFVSLYNTHM